ncbi:DUF2231 domain-containing protein [Rhodococcus artemisiae]|uniref:DUF2231 domain-containing protein n=1 Tax=Rhodococcus artemisiae TaxID=714159 RepID=A0ABU7LCL3_9NOCA|nr:DUF2231 domain-containing protein [Rhodococcus artemisiae]MEE2059295.1 DUF2231 domain-containing protein [Rhodococcus artemisiae]
MTGLFSTLESATALDRPSTAVRDVVRRITAGVPGDLLRGDVAPGHPLHPALVAIPIGAWSCAPLFDFVFRKPETARQLIGVGLVAALPSALTGWADFAECDTQQRRVGLVHAAVNGTGIALMGLSYLGRRRGTRPAAVAASTVATALIGFGGTLGGHLAFAMGARVEGNRNRVPSAGSAFDPVLA